jgi:hypothetical protein
LTGVVTTNHHRGTTEATTHPLQPSSSETLEATIAALQRDAASAARVLQRPRRSQAQPATPQLWDASPIDPRPDDCWRCDVASSSDALGLCPDCRADLDP